MLPKLSLRGLHLVRQESSAQASSQYRVGDPIAPGGIYRASHGDHRLAHEVTLLSGGLFPRCKKCGNGVTFELVAEAPAAMNDRDFPIRVYEIPHPEPDDANQVA